MEKLPCNRLNQHDRGYAPPSRRHPPRPLKCDVEGTLRNIFRNFSGTGFQKWEKLLPSSEALTATARQCNNTGPCKTAVRTVIAEEIQATDVDEGQVTDTVEALRNLSMEQQQRPPYRDYKTILQSSLAEVMARKRLSLRADDGETLLSYLRAIPPHPEVPAALERLRAQFRLAIISNTDDDLIAGTVAAIGVPIDFVITAQQARACKPDHQLFRHAHGVVGVTPEETVHVGMGQVTDLKVCHERVKLRITRLESWSTGGP